MSLFRTYVQELAELRESIQQSISAIEATTDAGQRNTEYRRAQSLIEEAQETLQAMKMEATGADREKVSGYEREVSQWKSSVDDAKYKSEHNALLGDTTGLEMLDVTSDDHRGRMAHATQRIDRAGDYVAQARSIAADTLELGVDGLSELERQDEVMRSGIDKIGSMNDKLSQAQRIMRRISATLVGNKLMLAGIVILLLIAIAIILYMKFLW